MSIFKKASDIEKLPDVVTNAFFDDVEPIDEVGDEFSELLKEAGKNKDIYERRVKSFKVAKNQAHDFEKPEQANYTGASGGIRRAGYGVRFQDEQSEMFGSEKIRSIAFDNNNMVPSNELSIWAPEFDELTEAFEKSQKATNAAFDRRTAAEKKALRHQTWEYEKAKPLRDVKILPYRGLGVARIGNETPVDHNKFARADDFYAEANDKILESMRTSKRELKTKLQRQGVSPEEARSQWENKDAISARTLSALQNNSDFLKKFAEEISLDDK